MADRVTFPESQFVPTCHSVLARRWNTRPAGSFVSARLFACTGTANALILWFPRMVSRYAMSFGAASGDPIKTKLPRRGRTSTFNIVLFVAVWFFERARSNGATTMPRKQAKSTGNYYFIFTFSTNNTSAFAWHDLEHFSAHLETNVYKLACVHKLQLSWDSCDFILVGDLSRGIHGSIKIGSRWQVVTIVVDGMISIWILYNASTRYGQLYCRNNNNECHTVRVPWRGAQQVSEGILLTLFCMITRQTYLLNSWFQIPFLFQQGRRQHQHQ